MAEAKAEEPAQSVEVAEAVPAEGGLLADIVGKYRELSRDEEQREQSSRQIKALVDWASQGTRTISKDFETTINTWIADIDEIISAQLNEVMHHSEFQKLEASWRGLRYLVMQSETSTMLKIKVLNASTTDLGRDLERATEFDQSAMFKKIYEEEFGTFGGVPFGALIGDYEFTRHPQDVAMLDKVSNVAAAAHAPFFAAAGPELFNLDSFTDLGTPRDLAKIFDTVEYAKYKSFRDSDDALCRVDAIAYFDSIALRA
jgi:type VI secretion system protein ImpC